MIIGIIGNKYTGKDTIADFLVENYNFNKYTFANPIKDISKKLFHLNDEQLNDPYLKEIKIPYWDLSPREIFQKIGTDLFRNNFDKDFWVKQFEINYLINNNHKNIVCSDIRFQNEAELIKKYNGILLKINRNTHKYDNHESEKLEIQDYDFEINNNSTLEDLYFIVEDILKKLMIEKKCQF
jgi:dephospho-CoA kinase